MPKKKKKNRKSQTSNTAPRKSLLLYHDMAVYENFERCTQRVLELLQKAQLSNPGAPRRLLFRVQGHRHSEGGYDHDSWEMIRYFLPNVILPYLTELSTPVYEARNPGRQSNLIPDELRLEYPEGDRGFWYDVDLLPLRSRETNPDGRKTPPSRQAIADYLGMSEACCLVCWDTPADRAHVVPTSLGGSMDVRNFALLCDSHHKQAPDIADAEAFWAWVDYAEIRDSGSKWLKASEDLKEWLHAQGVSTEMKSREELDFLSAVKFELQHLYGWSEVDFSATSWDLMHEYHRVLDAATGKHFGVDKKVSTHAWAYHVAKQRLAMR
ncbi:HNH endonuclease signature motif containing protein [Streptomyces sp. NPDC005526]|uniref:HNH endonuclease signature motif containing protein n=1 Tax=Streptomyces sp. NPDC005526 TaxID=3156885 RepID=UPI0033B5202D